MKFIPKVTVILLLLLGWKYQSAQIIKYSDSLIYPNVVDSVRIMAEVNILYSPSMGVGATETLQNIRFRYVAQNSSDEQLIILSYHPNSVIRCYAFLGLLNNSSNKILKSCNILYDDTSLVHNLYVGSNQKIRVVDFVYFFSKPSVIELHDIRLSAIEKKDLKKIRKKMKRYLSKPGIGSGRKYYRAWTEDPQKSVSSKP